MNQIYTGEIIFPPGTPFPSKYDGGKEVINVLVRMDDPSAPNANDPKTGPGEVRIYKNVGSADANYMQTLSRGDRVSLVWNEAGDKSGYTFLAMAFPEPPPPPSVGGGGYVNKQLAAAVPPPPTSQQREIVLDVQPDNYLEAWTYVMSCVADMYQVSVAQVQEAWPDMPEDRQHILASTWFNRGFNWWRPGAILAGATEPASNKANDKGAFLSLVNQDDRVASWLQAATIWLDSEQAEVLAIIKKLGIKSAEWLENSEGQWKLIQALEAWWNMVDNGLPEEAIFEHLNKAFDIKLPAAIPEPPPF